MPELSAGFREALQPILDELARAVGLPALRAELGTEHAPQVHEGVARVPVRHELHWRRFATLPTDLVRDLALAVRRQKGVPGEDEADWLLFAEVFVRDHLLSHD